MILCSLILRYAHETPHLPQPFRSAIFMNSYMPWSATEDLGKDVTPLVIQRIYVPSTLAEAERVLAIEQEKHATKEDMLDYERDADRGDGDLMPPMMRHAYRKRHTQDVEAGVERKYDDYRAHRIFPELDKVRVPMPSAHILGENDPMRELGEATVKLCDDRLTLVYKHGFGHEIPTRSLKDIRKIKDVIEKIVIRSNFV